MKNTEEDTLIPSHALETALRSFRSKAKLRDKHVSVEAVLAEIALYADVFPDFSFFLRQPKFFSDGKGNDLVLYRYSFGVFSGKLHRFQNLSSCIAALESQQMATRYSDSNVIVKTNDPRFHSSERLIRLICDVLSDVYYAFSFDNNLSASSRRLQKTILRENKNYDVRDLLLFIKREYAPNGLVLFNYGREGIVDTSKVENYGALEPAFLASAKDALKSALGRYDPSDGVTSTYGVTTHFVLIPASLNTWKAATGDGKADFVALFDIGQGVPEFLIRFIAYGIRSSSTFDKNRIQLNALQNAIRSKQRLLDGVRLGKLGLRNSRRKFVLGELERIVRDVYDCTAAHSVTVRRFNPFNDHLELIAQSEYSKWRDSIGQQSSISTSYDSSTNVQCFKNCRPGQHIYLPDMNTGSDNQTTPQKVFNPRNSRSEICFPIWKSAIPVGTLNVESPISFAFSDDVTFLESIASAISDLITAEYDAIPPTAVAQLSRVNELAHATLRGGSGEFDTRSLDELPVLLRSTVREWMHFENALRTPIVIEDDRPTDLRQVIIGVLQQSLISEQYERIDIDEYVQVPSISVGAYESAYIRSILLAITSNATKHSRLDEDFFRVQLKTRASRKYLVIQYKSEIGKVHSDIAEKYGLMPVHNEEGVRYGAFLLGSRVRSAGGLLEMNRFSGADNGSESNPLEFVIELPVGGE